MPYTQFSTEIENQAFTDLKKMAKAFHGKWVQRELCFSISYARYFCLVQEVIDIENLNDQNKKELTKIRLLLEEVQTSNFQEKAKKEGLIEEFLIEEFLIDCQKIQNLIRALSNPFEIWLELDLILRSMSQTELQNARKQCLADLKTLKSQDEHEATQDLLSNINSRLVHEDNAALPALQSKELLTKISHLKNLQRSINICYSNSHIEKSDYCMLSQYHRLREDEENSRKQSTFYKVKTFFADHFNIAFSYDVKYSAADKMLRCIRQQGVLVPQKVLFSDVDIAALNQGRLGLLIDHYRREGKLPKSYLQQEEAWKKGMSDHNFIHRLRP